MQGCLVHIFHITYLRRKKGGGRKICPETESLGHESSLIHQSMAIARILSVLRSSAGET